MYQSRGFAPRRLWQPFAIVVIWVLSFGVTAAADPARFEVRAGEPATLTFWNRPIVVFHAEIDGIRPRDRVVRSAGKIASILETSPGLQVRAVPGTLGNLNGYWIQIDGFQTFGLLPEDADSVSGDTLEQVVEHAVAALQGALDARREQARLPQLIEGFGLTLVATLALGVVLWGLVRLHHRALRRAGMPQRVAVKVGGIDLHPYLHALERAAIKLSSLGLAVIAAYVWLTFVLGLFPLTRPWGEGLAAFLVDLLTRLATGAIGSLAGALHGAGDLRPHAHGGADG